MKKTNIRVRRNGGSKPASPQVPNKPDSANVDRGEITIQFLTRQGEVMGKHELSAIESECFRVAADNLATPLESYAHIAVLEKIARAKLEVRLLPLMVELEDSIDQAEVLGFLLREASSGRERAGWSDSLQNGLVHLSAETFGKLRRAKEACAVALQKGITTGSATAQ